MYIDVKILIVNILTTIVIYMSYPFWRFSGKKNTYTKSTLIKNLLFNSLIATVVMILIGITIFKDTYELNYSFTLPITYYFINYLIWKNKSYESKTTNKKKIFINTYGSFIIVIITIIGTLFLTSSIVSFNEYNKSKKNKEIENDFDNTSNENITPKTKNECLEAAENYRWGIRWRIFCTNGNYYEDECSKIIETYQQKIDECNKM